MKKTKLALLIIAIATAGLLSFQKPAPTSIKGKVIPAFYAMNAWIMSPHDTLYTSVTDGKFEFNVEPGTYRLVIEARSPYRHMAKDGIVVKEGQPTDIGELSLQRWESSYK